MQKQLLLPGQTRNCVVPFAFSCWKDLVTIPVRRRLDWGQLVQWVFQKQSSIALIFHLNHLHWIWLVPGRSTIETFGLLERVLCYFVFHSSTSETHKATSTLALKQLVRIFCWRTQYSCCSMLPTHLYHPPFPVTDLWGSQKRDNFMHFSKFIVLHDGNNFDATLAISLKLDWIILWSFCYTCPSPTHFQCGCSKHILPMVNNQLFYSSGLAVDSIESPSIHNYSLTILKFQETKQ